MEITWRYIMFVTLIGRNELAGSQNIGIKCHNEVLSKLSSESVLLWTRKAKNETRKLAPSATDGSIFSYALQLYRQKNVTFVVHGNVPLLFALLFRIARFGKNTCIVNYCHGHPYSSLNGFLRFLTAYFIRLIHVDLSVYVCMTDSRSVFKLNSRRELVVHNPIIFPDSNLLDINHSDFDGRLDNCFLSIIRLAPQKGQAVVKSKVRDLDSTLRSNNFYLDLIEPGFNCNPFSNVNSRDWLNFTNEIVNYRAFVSFSLYESHPLAVLEAVAKGVPVFLSDIASHRELGLPKESYFSLSEMTQWFQNFSFSDARLKLLASEQRQILNSKYYSDVKWSKLLRKSLHEI